MSFICGPVHEMRPMDNCYPLLRRTDLIAMLNEGELGDPVYSLY